jgi:cysteine desulfurase / selenocysteine lyase
VRVRRIRPRDRVVTADELAAAISRHTRIFCITWVHSFSGYVADLEALGQVCRERGVFLVVNGSQAVGVRPIDVQTAPIDALVSVGFKWLCGPYGTGFAWIRPQLRARLQQIKAYWLAQLTQADLLAMTLTSRSGLPGTTSMSSVRPTSTTSCRGPSPSNMC